MLGPVIEQIADERSGAVKVGKVNVDEEPSLADRAGVRGIPYVVLYRDGEPAAQAVGAQPKAKLEQALGPRLPGRRLKLSALLETQVWLEEGTQLHAPAMQAALERRLADAGDLGRVVRG